MIRFAQQAAFEVAGRDTLADFAAAASPLKTGRQFVHPSPIDPAQPYDLAVGAEGDAENLGYRSQSANIQTNATFRYVQDEALNPRRIRFTDQKARPVINDPFVLSAAKVISMSH